MALKSLSSKDLQILVKSKNHKAFEELYNRYWKKIFVICNNRLQNADIAQDLVQDIFISLWNNENVDSIENIDAYLYQSSKFAVIKELHKQIRYDNIAPTEIGILDKVAEFDLNEVLDAKLLDALLQVRIDMLPAKTKIIFNYSRKDNLNSKEIAEKLNISHRTVENQISFVLKELRNFLQKVKSIIIF